MRRFNSYKNIFLSGYCATIKLLIICSLAIVSTNSFSQPLALANLRCEYRQNPIGVDVSHPKLSWELQSGQRGVLQTAYRILVSEDSLMLLKNIGSTWDSKKITTSASIQVAYGGKPLQATKKYFWKVMVWDNKSNQSFWSGIANWQMPFLVV